MTNKIIKRKAHMWEKEMLRLEKKFFLDRDELLAWIREETSKTEEEKIIDRLVEIIFSAGEHGINYARLKSKACQQFQSHYIEDQLQIVGRMLKHRSIERIPSPSNRTHSTIFRSTTLGGETHVGHQQDVRFQSTMAAN